MTAGIHHNSLNINVEISTEPARLARNVLRRYGNEGVVYIEMPRTRVHGQWSGRYIQSVNDRWRVACKEEADQQVHARNISRPMLMLGEADVGIIRHASQAKAKAD